MRTASLLRRSTLANISQLICSCLFMGSRDSAVTFCLLKSTFKRWYQTPYIWSQRQMRNWQTRRSKFWVKTWQPRWNSSSHNTYKHRSEPIASNLWFPHKLQALGSWRSSGTVSVVSLFVLRSNTCRCSKTKCMAMCHLAPPTSATCITLRRGLMQACGSSKSLRLPNRYSSSLWQMRGTLETPSCTDYHKTTVWRHSSMSLWSALSKTAMRHTTQQEFKCALKHYNRVPKTGTPTYRWPRTF